MKRVKLNALANNAMNKIRGGDQTTPEVPENCPYGYCACYYQNNGGSSTADNSAANLATGASSIIPLPNVTVSAPKL